MSKAVEDVLAERRRQVEAEGWTPEHDDLHSEREIALAAGCYAMHAGMSEEARANQSGAPLDWPWDFGWWKPTTARRDLVKAAALAIAEIERIDGHTATVTAAGEKAVLDTWFTDRTLPVMAMSADIESDRVLRLHFRRPVTDDDRKALCDALNMHQAAQGDS